MLPSEMATNSYRLTSSDARECPREESDLLSLGHMPKGKRNVLIDSPTGWGVRVGTDAG